MHRRSGSFRFHRVVVGCCAFFVCNLNAILCLCAISALFSFRASFLILRCIFTSPLPRCLYFRFNLWTKYVNIQKKVIYLFYVPLLHLDDCTMHTARHSVSFSRGALNAFFHVIFCLCVFFSRWLVRCVRHALHRSALVLYEWKMNVHGNQIAKSYKIEMKNINKAKIIGENSQSKRWKSVLVEMEMDSVDDSWNAVNITIQLRLAEDECEWKKEADAKINLKSFTERSVPTPILF